MSFRDYAESVGAGVPRSAVAAPSGFSSAAQGQSGFADYAQSVGVEAQPLDMEGSYRQWYTGQNLEGQANGWNTKFMEVAQTQYVQSLEEGQPEQRFSRPDAVGVVTWDGARDSENTKLEFGDVVVDGVKVANVYEDVDRHTANILMGEWTIQDGAKKARLNQAGDFEKAWDEEIQRIRTESTQQAELAPRAREFQEGTEERAEENQALSAFGTTSLGAGGGAAMGAGIGTLVAPGIGTAIGAVAGTAFGALASWLNQDALGYQVAREQEKLDVIRSQGNGELSSFIGAAAAITNSAALNPLANMVSGLYDVSKDTSFDHRTGGAFYETNEMGERTTPGLVQAIEVAARAGDGLLTFASPLGRTVYTAQMGVGIGARTAGLLPGVGQWDDSRLQMDSVWTDENGDFDPGSAAAGIANAGVEVVQLAGFRGLFSKAQRTAGKKAPSWFEQRNLSAEQRTAIARGGEIETLAGYKFVFNKEGELVGKGKTTLAMLAPSESLQSLAAKALTRREAARQKGAIQTEVLYQKAFDLTVGEKKMQTMLVNAFGEAQEEGLQQVLEPLSHNAAISPEEVFRSAAAGFASGFGMGGAAVLARPSADKQMYRVAAVAHALRTGGDELTEAQWNKMSQLEKRQMTRASQLATSVAEGGWKKMEADRVEFEQGGVVAADHVRDWFKRESTSALATGLTATDASHTIVMMDSARFRPDAVATSLLQMYQDQQNRTTGIDKQLKNSGDQIEELEEQQKETPDDPDLERRIKELKQQAGDLSRMKEFSEFAERAIDAAGAQVQAAYESGNIARARSLQEGLNAAIQDWYDMTKAVPPGFTERLSMRDRRLLAKAVSRIVTRHPEDSSGSFHSFVPQVDHFFTQRGSHGLAAVSQLTNMSMRSDFDGDKIHELQQLALDDTEYMNMRAGTNIIGATVKPEISTTKYEKWLLEEARVAHQMGGAMADLVKAVGDAIEADLRFWYDFAGVPERGEKPRRYIPSHVIDEVMDKVREALRDGGDVRDVLLTEMFRRAPSELQAIGMGEMKHQGILPLSNQPFVLAQMVTEHLQTFQSAYAKVTKPTGSMPANVAPNQMSTDAKTIHGEEAATAAAQMFEVLPGDDIFRMFQKLHYSVMNSTDLYIGWDSDVWADAEFAELTQFYEALSRAASGLKFEELPAGDMVTTRVIERLSSLARNQEAVKKLTGGTTMANTAVLANLMTARYIYDTNEATGRTERYYTGERVSLAQQLLYESLQEFRHEKREVWSQDQTLQTTYNRLMAMTKPQTQGVEDGYPGNAERAFVEVFESVPLYDIVGPDAQQLGVTLTVGQMYRRELSTHPDKRAADYAAIKTDGAYRKQVDGQPNDVTIPYGIGEVKDDKKVTAFRTLVDAVFSAASSEISITRSGKTQGKLKGRMVTRDNKARDLFVETHKTVRELLYRLEPRESYSPKDLARLIEAHPEIGALILKVIPDRVMPVVYRGRNKDGTVKLARWVYRVFAEPDAKASEADFRRNIWIDTWDAKKSALDTDNEDIDKNQVLEYSGLESRMHQVFFRLALLKDSDSTVVQEFYSRLNETRDLDKFFEWLNSQTSLLGSSVPMLPRVDDTADFDADKTGSGWTEKKSAPQLLEDLEALRVAAARQIGLIDGTKARNDQDRSYARSIRRALMDSRGELPPGQVASDKDKLHYEQFKAAVENARKRDVGSGMRTMLMNTATLAFGIYAPAHTKGSNPEHLAAMEALGAIQDAFGYVTNFERVMGDVTSHNEDAVAASPDLIVKSGGRMTDKHGVQVEWDADTSVETLLGLIEDDRYNDLVRGMLFPQVMEIGPENRPQRQLLMGDSIKDLLNSTSNRDLYPDNGRPGLRQAMTYLSNLESKVRGKSSFAVQQKVTELVLARTTALGRGGVSFAEIQEMTVQAYLDMATVLQELGRTQPGPKDKDPVHEAFKLLKQELRQSAAASAYGVSSDLDYRDLEKLDGFLQSQIIDRYAGRIDEINRSIAAIDGSTPEGDAQQTKLTQYVEDLTDEMDRQLERLDVLLKGDVIAQTVTAYNYDEKMSDTEKRDRRTILEEYVAKNGDLLQGAGEALPTVQKVFRSFYRSKKEKATNPFTMTDKEWTALSKLIISAHIQKQVTVGDPKNTPIPYPDKPEKEGELDKTRFFDFTWSLLSDFMSEDDTSGLLQAAREDARTSGQVSTARDTVEILSVLSNTIYKKDSLGEWTASYPSQAIESYALLSGASSSVAISMAGLITQRHSAVAAATERTYEIPPPEMDSQVELSWAEVNKKDNTGSYFDHIIDIEMPEGPPIKRPLIQVDRRFTRKVVFNYEHPTQGTVPVDLSNNLQVVIPSGRAYSRKSPVTDELKVLDLARMRAEIERIVRDAVGNDQQALTDALSTVSVAIDFLHPEAQPAEEKWFNNLYFEGTVFDSAGDMSDSLLYSLWFGPGGVNPVVQQGALDTRKKGTQGIESYLQPDRDAVRILEARAEDDFGEMLAGKAELVMKTDLGGGRLDPSFYNAVFKLLKLKHWVQGTDHTGKVVRIPAEQVIQNQIKYGQGQGGYFDADGNPLRNARLWIASDQVLASMMGEIGYGGVSGKFAQDSLTTNLDEIPRYRGQWTERMEDLFPTTARPKKFWETDVAKSLRMSTHSGRVELDATSTDRYARKQELIRKQRVAVQDQRDQQRIHGFKPEDTMASAKQVAQEAWKSQDITLDLPDEIKWMALPSRETLAASRSALEQYINWQRGESGGAVAGWVYQHDGPSSAITGVLNKAALDGRLKLMPGDIVVFDTSSFPQSEKGKKEAQDALRYLVSQNVTILPVASAGPNRFTAELSGELREQYGYQRYRESPRILVPQGLQVRKYQNARAAASRLREAQAVRVRDQRVSVLLKDVDIEENTMLVPIGRNTKFRTLQLVEDLAPLNVSSRFGVPQTREQLEKLRNTLVGLDSDAGRAYLKSMIEGDKDGNEDTEGFKTFDEAWRLLLQNLDAMIAANTTLPQPGMKFDIVPLMDSNGMIFLSRQGYKFPYETLEKQLRSNLRGETGALGIAVAGGKREPSATVRNGVGTVSRVKNRGKYGVSIEMEVPVDELGEKVVFEMNGMKWLLAPLGSQLVEPSMPLMGQGEYAVNVDGYGSLWDAMGKQATAGFVTDFRNAFTFFGNTRIIEDVSKFFGKDPDITRRVLRQVEQMPDKLTEGEVKELQNYLFSDTTYVQTLASLVPRLKTLVDTNWLERIDQNTHEAHVTKALLLYLMSEGSNLDAVLYSSGLYIDNLTEAKATSQAMPSLFTRAFDLAPIGSPVRSEYFRRFNEVLGGSGKAGYEGWELDEAFNLIITDADGNQHEGIIDMGTAYVSDDNILLNSAAQLRKKRQGSSMHGALVTKFGAGGTILPDGHRLDKLDRPLAKQPRESMDRGEMWKLLTDVNPSTYGPGSLWQRRQQQEHDYYKDAIQRFVAYRQPIDWTAEEFLNAERRFNVENLRDKKNDVMTALGLQESQGELVDFWIRQMMWRPGRMQGQEEIQDKFDPSLVDEVLETMLSNLRRGLLPTYGAPGPSFFSEIDLRVLHTAFKRTGKWAPNNEEGNDKTRVGDNYGDWVRLAFGQGLHPDVEIDSAYLLDLDGFMNTYRDVLKDMGHLFDYSLNKELQSDFFDAKTNELLAVSTSPIVRQQLMEQVILPKLNLDFGDLNTGVGTSQTVAGLLASSGFRAHSRRRVAAWRRANKVRPEKRTSNAQFIQYGAQVLENNGETHSLTRILLALRHGTTMLNPGLYISMIPEQGFRMYLNGMANVLTGQSTSRGVGGLASRMKINEYDPETIKALNDLYDSMSNDSSFAGLIIKDLMYQQPQGDTSAGKIVRGIERFAAVGNKWQDPTWGIRQRAMARTYVEAVIRAVNSMPISNAISLEQIIARLRTDPAWIANNHPEIHQMASNSVVDLRGLKHTPTSLAIKALYEPLTRSSSATLQFAGTLLKLPLMYANFNANMLTTLTGMQGYSQIVATFMDGRQTAGTLMHRLAKGKNGQPLTPEDDIRYDMSSTMDGYTIANAFIRGGVTQTGLFMIGMLTGGILTGEDEEARRRRKLAEAQNAPYVADPRRLEADFRNKDMIFTDWLPPQLSAFFNVSMEDESQDMRSAFQMSWLMKPFLSPILGMERFLQTGDFGWVTYGFLDGVGSMPLFNKSMWDDAVRSVDELTMLAEEQQELGTPDSTRNTMYLLTSAVSVYERMLLENMFVNSLYSGFDTYDRDPTKLPLLDSDGDMQVTIEGNPRPNDLALQTFVNKDGELQQGYLNRDTLERNLAYYTENNASAAAILSLVTGFQRGLSRYSMPVKMQELELPQITDKESKVLVSELLRQTWAQAGAAPKHLSLEEITKKISSEAAAAGNWDVYNKADVLAAELYESDANPMFDPMSIVDENDNEVLTTTGAARILDSIRKGGVTLDSPSLQGISIPFEMREQIQADFLNDVTQEGVDMGMTNSQAISRAKRLFYGPLDNPDIVGFSDILWSDQIAYSNKRQYKQLNTTYTKGPDGYPWATGFKRGGALAQLGLPARANLGPAGSTTTDGRMNTVDLVAGINTGMRGLVPFDASENIPTDKEIGDAIVKAIEDLELKSNDFEPFDKKNSSGKFYRRGGYTRYRRGGGSYGSSGMPTIYFSRMPRLPDGTNIYGGSTKNIFWDNVTIKRTRIRRERVQSSRGRLNQWQ